MPVFAYKAMDQDASAVSGQVAADTPRQARDLLRERGLVIESMAEHAQTGDRHKWRPWAARPRLDRVAECIRDLSTLLAAGIPLLDALDVLTGQFGGPFRPVLLALREDVAAGNSLADAMARQGTYFDDLCVSITRVGENTGTLDATLAKLAEFKEHASRVRGKVGTALLYPAVVGLVGVSITIFLMTFVVPNILTTLVQAGRPLPAVTRIVKGMSDLLIHYGWAAALAGVAVAVGVRLLLATQGGRRRWDYLLLRLPLLGELIAKESIARLSIVLAALLRSGVVLSQAVQIARATIANRIFQDALAQCEEAILAGRDIAQPLGQCRFFPPMVVRMLAVGQQTGELERMLEQLAAGYEQRVETATARLTAVLEPALIIILAMIVGFVAFATILPILEASRVL